MRVLYLTLNPNRESTTVPTEGWFRLLRPRGLEPVVISSQSGAFQEWVKSEGIPSYAAKFPFPDKKRPTQFLVALARLLKIARKHQVDLIHCNEHDVYPIGQYAGRFLRVPVLVSVHFQMDRGFTSWAFAGAKRPQRMFFVSHSSLEACRPALDGIVSEDTCRVLYNGLDMEHYQRSETLRAEFRKVHGLEGNLAIGVACALRPRKQLEHLFAAAEAAPPHVRVVVAGGPVPGDEAYAEQLMADGKRRLGDRLIYLGHLRELRPLYNALDLFVNTSHEESFGLSVLEAMACGCPVLGYPSVSVSEVVLPGGGEIVPQGDLQALTDAMRRWLADDARRLAARAAARQRAEAFDIRLFADVLWNEYQAILESNALRAGSQKA